MKRPVKQTTERRISAAVRIAFVLILLLLHVGAVLLLTSFLQVHAAIFFGILEAAAIAVAVNIQSTAASTSYKLAWTLLVLAVPVAGMILYILWGGNIQGKRLGLLPVTPPPSRDEEREQSVAIQRRLAEALPNWKRASQMLAQRDFLLYQDTAVTYFPSGADFFRDAADKMVRAERFIFLEYFILAEGLLWDQLLAILIERARQGVEIKVIFDDFGNITRMRSETIARMREAGMEVAVFNPVHRYVNRLYFNYRDHRKILCVDGQYAYTGGANIADEYVGYTVRFGEWKDSGILLDGPGAWGLTSRFIHMWEQLGDRLPQDLDFYRATEVRQAQGWCQPFTDGPDNNPDNPAEDIYLQCISNAHDYIWLTTPYFAVEDSMVRALCMASDSGVDVRLMLPGIPDHPYTDIVARSHYGRLLQHGVKLYEFTPGFLHAKSFAADGETALVGTINMDYRSFQLHYECGVMLYGSEAIAPLLEDMREIMARSVQVDGACWSRRSWLMRILEKILRVFSIWM